MRINENTIKDLDIGVGLQRVRAVGCPVGGAQRLLLQSSVLRNTPDQIIVIGSKHVR